MKFLALNRLSQRDSVIIYRAKDHALATSPQRPSVGLNLAINDVQIELTEDGRWDSIWGYCPRQSWKEGTLTGPSAELGELRMVAEKALLPGVAVRLGKGRWPVVFCPESSWLCFGDSGVFAGAYQVEFAPGAIVVGDESRIAAIWLRIARFE